MRTTEEIWNENIHTVSVSGLNFVLCGPILCVFANPFVKESAFSETWRECNLQSILKLHCGKGYNF